MHFSNAGAMERARTIGYKLTWIATGNPPQAPRLPDWFAFAKVLHRTVRYRNILEVAMSVRRDWKSTVLSVPLMLLAGAAAFAQAPQANPAAIRRRRTG
jgi:hypothetical protein